MTASANNRPLFDLAPDRDARCDRIYANREGMLLLRDALSSLLDGKTAAPLPRLAVYQNGNWKWLEVDVSTQEDFNCEGVPCQCGCQADFATVEEAYQRTQGGTIP